MVDEELEAFVRRAADKLADSWYAQGMRALDQGDMERLREELLDFFQYAKGE